MVDWFILCFNDGNVTADNCIQGGTKKTSAKMKMLLTMKGKCFGNLLRINIIYVKWKN